MRTLLFFFSLVCFSATGLAQSPVGSWVITTPSGTDGADVTWQLTFKADGTYAVDIGVDGSVDLTGKYTVEGNTVTVQNDAGCTSKGVYKFGVENDRLWMDPVEDSCEGRKPPQKVFFSKA